MICGEIAGWDGQDRFTERAANAGSLGVFEAKYLIRYMQANAKRLDKFGA
jgi:2,3-bisphosphoglycerate-independent phosphoglycerate mutase